MNQTYRQAYLVYTKFKTMVERIFPDLKVAPIRLSFLSFRVNTANWTKYSITNQPTDKNGGEAPEELIQVE